MILTRSGRELKHEVTLEGCGFTGGVKGYRVQVVYKQQDAESLERTKTIKKEGLKGVAKLLAKGSLNATPGFQRYTNKEGLSHAERALLTPEDMKHIAEHKAVAAQAKLDAIPVDLKLDDLLPGIRAKATA